METNDRKVIILRGIPASGKSTLAKEYVSKGYKKVGKDELRRMINGYSLDNADEDMIHSIQYKIIKTFMAFGRNIIVDNTHAKKSYITDLTKDIVAINATIDYDYEIEVVVLDTQLEECLKRNAQRATDKVPENVIRKMYNQLQSSL